MPYAPGISYDNSGLMRGILQGSAGIAAGLEKYQEQKKAIVQNSKYAEGIFKTNPEIQKRLGMSEDEFKALSAQDKIALSSGAIASIHNEVEQMKAKESAQRIKTLEQTQSYHQQLNEQNTALGKFAQDYAQGPQAFNLENSAPGNQADILQQYAPAPPEARIMNALKRNPAAFASPQFDNSVQGLQRFTTPPKVKMNPALGEVIDLKDGGRILGMGPENPPHFAPSKEKKFSALQDKRLYSTDPKDVGAAIQEIKDPEDRALAIAAAHSFQHIFPQQSEVDKLLSAMGGGKLVTPAKTDSNPGQKPAIKKGQRGIINGKNVQFDGTKWREISAQ